MQFLFGGSYLNNSERYTEVDGKTILAIALVYCPAIVFRWYAQLEELKFHLPHKRFSKLGQVSMEFVGAFYSLNDLWPEIW